jgi:hypothetical protein
VRKIIVCLCIALLALVVTVLVLPGRDTVRTCTGPQGHTYTKWAVKHMSDQRLTRLGC